MNQGCSPLVSKLLIFCFEDYFFLCKFLFELFILSIKLTNSNPQELIVLTLVIRIIGISMRDFFECYFLNSYSLSCFMLKYLFYQPPTSSLSYPNPTIFVTLDVTLERSPTPSLFNMPTLFKGLSLSLSSFE